MPLGSQSSGAEAYVSLLCWKKTFAAQKCDLLVANEITKALDLAPLSNAQAEPALARTAQLGYLSRWPAFKDRGAEAGQCLGRG